ARVRGKQRRDLDQPAATNDRIDEAGDEGRKPERQKQEIGIHSGSFHVKQRHLPMQKREKITPSRSSAVNSPVISLMQSCARRNSSANSSSACAHCPACARCAFAPFSACRCRSRARTRSSPCACQPATRSN